MSNLLYFIVLFSHLYISSLDVSSIYGLPDMVRIGILLHDNQYEQEILFRWSIEQVNQQKLLNRTKLHGLMRRVKAGDSWDAEKRACELFDDGAIAIIGPPTSKASSHIGSICDALDVPHFNIITRGVLFQSQSTGTNMIVGSSNPRKSRVTFQSHINVDLSLSHEVLIRAHLDILRVLDWRNFVYLYEDDDSLYDMQRNYDGKSSEMKVLRFDPAKSYRDTFWRLKKTNIHHIMLDVKCSSLRSVLKQAQQVSMMTEAHSYLIVCLDTHTIDLEDFRHSKSRIVWLSSSDSKSEAMKLLATYTSDSGPSYGMVTSSSFRLKPEQLKTESALVHDAIQTFAHTLQEVDLRQYIVGTSSVSCLNSKPWPYGSTIVNYIRTSIEVNGMTGKVSFNTVGQRSDYTLNVMRLTADYGPTTIGNWSTNREHGKNLFIEHDELMYLLRGDPVLYEDDQKETLIVVSIRNEPYFMNKLTTKIETGNARYEGYAIDLIDELSRLVGFDYVFKEVDDGKYGKYDEEKMEWNGMIREVMMGKADLAIADLSITSSREDAVDFTLPFRSTGISILFKKPTTKELELFSFLSPFESQVWVYVCGAYISVSLLLFIVGRISPYEWTDPHPCRQEHKILRNQFSITNSFWFTIAAMMQQGSDLAPKSLSTRLVAAIWYFFTLIMISSYTANLAAFLTVEKVVYSIERAEDLYRHPQHIKYGCVESGSTSAFFQNSKPTSTFRKMYDEMVFVQSNDKGKEEAEKGNYAFFMESTSIEYTIERNCNLTQIGGLLDTKGYGIGLAKNSTRKRDYRTKLSEAILSLQESGVLRVLKNRWWKEKRGGGACDNDDSQGGENVKELTLANVGGVFVVLGMGITVSFTLCAIEIYTKSRRLALAHGTSKWAQVKRRIKFALSLSENY